MSDGPPGFEKKIHDPAGIAGWLGSLARPLVFTNGVFDLIHRGHATCLARARTLGSSLLVALNSDASVRRLGKGTDRPIVPLEDRLALMAAQDSVDAVTWFDEDDPRALISRCEPDVLVKGGDWPAHAIAGADVVLARGGRVLSIPFEFDRSTTALLARIRGIAGRS